MVSFLTQSSFARNRISSSLAFPFSGTALSRILIVPSSSVFIYSVFGCLVVTFIRRWVFPVGFKSDGNIKLISYIKLPINLLYIEKIRGSLDYSSLFSSIRSFLVRRPFRSGFSPFGADFRSFFFSTSSRFFSSSS